MAIEPNVNKTAQGSSVHSTTEQSINIAGVLSEVLDFLDSVAITQDFFEGYSLSEAIQERLDLIGGEGQVYTQGPRGLQTLLSSLDTLESQGLQAIRAARDLKPVDTASDEDASIDPVQVDNSETYLVED